MHNAQLERALRQGFPSVPANVAAKIANACNRSCDFTGSSKRHIYGCFINAIEGHPNYPKNFLKITDADVLSFINAMHRANSTYKKAFEHCKAIANAEFTEYFNRNK